MHDPSKKAVCAAVISGRKILGVSRKDNPNDFGLPGGKVDPGETLEEAVLRELHEETGLDGIIIRHVYTDYDDHEWLVSTFLVEANGEPSSDEEGVVRWCDPTELVEGTSFSWYNQRILTKIGFPQEASEVQFQNARAILLLTILVILSIVLVQCLV